jgi:DNA-binding CsgD family transcriptional regulator
MEAIGIGSVAALNGREWGQIVGSLELAPQQARIVELILKDKSDKQIAREMGIALPTVRTYMSRIFQRTGCADRVGLVLKVFRCALELRIKNGGPQK